MCNRDGDVHARIVPFLTTAVSCNEQKWSSYLRHDRKTSLAERPSPPLWSLRKTRVLSPRNPRFIRVFIVVARWAAIRADVTARTINGSNKQEWRVFALVPRLSSGATRFAIIHFMLPLETACDAIIPSRLLGTLFTGWQLHQCYRARNL